MFTYVAFKQSKPEYSDAYLSLITEVTWKVSL